MKPFMFTAEDFPLLEAIGDQLYAAEQANAKMLEWYSREHAPLLAKLKEAEDLIAFQVTENERLKATVDRAIDEIRILKEIDRNTLALADEMKARIAKLVCIEPIGEKK